jgi:ribosomal-protein-alanine N-acetyltransferase
MNATTYILRRATQFDISAIVALEQDLFTDPWNREGFSDALKYYHELFFVAIEKNEIVGFICGGMEDTGEEIYGHIMNLATMKNMQRKGIGGSLLRRLELECMVRGAGGMQLEVRVSNTAAQEFYRKYGYTQVFVIDQYYSDGEDAILMMRWFT